MTPEEFEQLQDGDKVVDPGVGGHPCIVFGGYLLRTEGKLQDMIPGALDLVSKAKARQETKDMNNTVRDLLDKLERLQAENIELRNFNSMQETEKPEKYVYSESFAHSERDFYKNMVFALQAISGQLDYIIRQTL